MQVNARTAERQRIQKPRVSHLSPCRLIIYPESLLRTTDDRVRGQRNHGRIAHSLPHSLWLHP